MKLSSITRVATPFARRRKRAQFASPALRLAALASVACPVLLAALAFGGPGASSARAQAQDWASFSANREYVDYFSDIASDSQGNIYAVGSSSDFNILVSKFNRRGVRAWQQRLQPVTTASSAELNSVGTHIAVSPDGASVFVGGNFRSQQPGESFARETAILKLTADTGARTWTRVLRAPGGSFSGFLYPNISGFIPLADGGLCLASNRFSIGWIALRLAAADGASVWEKNFDGSSAYDAVTAGLVVDEARGAVYVTGVAPNGLGAAASTDATTIRYNLSDGAFRWEARYGVYNGRGKSQGKAIALDKTTGDVFISGAEIIGDRAQAVTVKYKGETGVQLWASLFQTPASEGTNPDDAHLLVVTPQDDPILAVDNQEPDQQPALTKGTFAVIKYNGATGERLWARRVKALAPVSVQDGRRATDLAVTPDGGAVVTYTGYYDTRRFVTRYSRTGTDLWAQDVVLDRFAPRSVYGRAARAVLYDAASGAVYAAGGDDYFGSSANAAWLARFAPRAYNPDRIATGADGGTRVLWRKWDGGASVASVGAAGQTIARRTFAAPQGWHILDLAVGGDGKTRLLWENEDGVQVAVWTLGANLTLESGYKYNASTVTNSNETTARYSVAGLSVGGLDNQNRLLWGRTGGALAKQSLLQTLATPASYNGVSASHSFGEYGGLSVLALASGAADGQTRFLWRNGGAEQLTLWTLKPDETAPLFGKTFARPAGYQYNGFAVGGDNKARLLWVRDADQAAAIWRFGTTGVSVEAGNVFGPFADVVPAAVSSGLGVTDARPRLLWRYDDGRAALWTLNPPGDGIAQSVVLPAPAP